MALPAPVAALWLKEQYGLPAVAWANHNAKRIKDLCDVEGDGQKLVPVVTLGASSWVRCMSYAQTSHFLECRVVDGDGGRVCELVVPLNIQSSLYVLAKLHTQFVVGVALSCEIHEMNKDNALVGAPSQLALKAPPPPPKRKPRPVVEALPAVALPPVPDADRLALEDGEEGDALADALEEIMGNFDEQELLLDAGLPADEVAREEVQQSARVESDMGVDAFDRRIQPALAELYSNQVDGDGGDEDAYIAAQLEDFVLSEMHNTLEPIFEPFFSTTRPDLSLSRYLSRDIFSPTRPTLVET
jgi:hypothetical protein